MRVRFLDGPLAGQIQDISDGPIRYAERWLPGDDDIEGHFTYIQKPNLFDDDLDAVFALEGSKAGNRVRIKMEVSDRMIDSGYMDLLKDEMLDELRSVCATEGMMPVQIEERTEPGSRPGMQTLIYDAIAMPDE